MAAHSAGMFMARVLDMILHHDPFETSLSAKVSVTPVAYDICMLNSRRICILLNVNARPSC